MRRVCLFVFALLVFGCTSDDTSANRNTVPPTPKPAVAQPKPPAVVPVKPGGATEEMATPYFTTGPAGVAARQLALKDWQAARDGFNAVLASPSAPKDKAVVARMKLLVAIADSALGNWKSAAVGFEYSLAHLPLLSDYLHYQAGRAHFFARAWQRAIEHCRKVSATAVNILDAKLLIGDSLRSRRKHAEVAAHYAAYLKDHPKGYRRAEARYRLAEAQEKLGRGLPESVTNYRRITIEHPTSRWSKRANKRMKPLLKSLPPSRRRRYTRLSAAELIKRGMVQYNRQRNLPAADTFKSALKARPLTKAQACVAAYHRANSLFKAKKRKDAAKALDRAAKNCRRAKNADLTVKANYQAGRAYAYLRKRRIAIARYRAAETEHPGHSYADDARLRQAEEYTDLNDQASVTRILAKLPTKFPKGDMATEALWRLAWRAYTEKRYAEAIRYLEQQIKIKPIEDNYWAEGQAYYWLARSHAKLGASAKADEAYKQAIRRYPLSYYALLAFNRLRKTNPAAFGKMKTEIAKVPAGYDPKKPAFEFDLKALTAEPGFNRGIELLRLGLGKLAEAQFARLKLTPPKGRKEVTDPAQRNRLWLMALLHDRAGRFQPSHWVTRWHLAKYKRSWPTGYNRARWDIAYPRAFWNLIEKNAKRHGYPAALQIAIVREESAFDPTRESWANAIGLTQMIFPTAKRFGRGTGIAITRKNLRDPEKNLRIGSNFLAFLWRKWKGSVGLIPPSYNAGEGATAKWLRRRGTWLMDEWAEAVPYDETRRYNKRVTATFFAYSYLKDGTIPLMPNRIPPELIPAPRRKR